MLNAEHKITKKIEMIINHSFIIGLILSKSTFSLNAFEIIISVNSPDR